MAPTPTASARRKHIEVWGIVQGVGFRPFVYNVAHSLGLAGYVYNSSSGVTIEVEGAEIDLDAFVESLRSHPPQLSAIAGIAVSNVEACGDSGFIIHESHEELGGFSLVSPDAGTCDACWRDFGDPMNRRYGYPFTNCTHCGPRYTIIQDIPYDRATTTMSTFTMCPDCAAEYANPYDRRFHAQPNACGVCGPSLELIPQGTSLIDCTFADRDSLIVIHKAQTLLREGKILAVKGLGGYLLACDASNGAAVNDLRRRKRRPDKPFALMARDVAAVRKLCKVSAEDEVALLSVRRPIVVMPRLPAAEISSKVGAGVSGGNDTLGVMLPYTPLHYLLFSDSPDTGSGFNALVMTSGNLSEEPIVVSNSEAMHQLGSVADWFLLHNRDIWTRVDDSVVRTFEGRERVLRRSRGFVPQTIDLGIDMNEVLAFGGELKNTFCLTKSRYAILSQHIGDLENYETMQFFEETLDRMKKLFRVSPQAVAHDLHPGYWSTRLALASSIERKIGVQHHHAHIASCMAENHLRGKVIGVAFDGTGYGLDGKIWGGEFMVADLAEFTRRAHLRYVPLPGGDAAVRQPWRMALSYLRDAFVKDVPVELTHFPGVTEKQVGLVDTMLSKQIQTVETSSCGRLFDAVAAMLGLTSEVTFEGQAAIALETAAARAPDSPTCYPFDINAGEPLILDLRATIIGIAGDIAQRVPAETVSVKFHSTLATAIVEMCIRIRESDGIDRVCLSGGTFQNLFLLERTIVQLRRRGFAVFLHALVPANDGGIALGQAAIANELLRRDG